MSAPLFFTVPDGFDARQDTACTAPQTKAALRKACLVRRASLCAALRLQSSARICARLTALPAYQAARTVFCFVGAGNEVDTAELIQKVIQDGKILCVPFCLPHQRGVMEAKSVTRLSRLVPGAFGIPAPPAGAQTVAPQSIDLAVVPCVAADETGLRLGYGGGYYDRYVPQLSASCTTVAACFQALLLPVRTIPAHPHDARVHAVATEQALWTSVPFSAASAQR